MLSKWSGLVEEVKKCILVCANCHREIHAGMHSECINDINNDVSDPLNQHRLHSVLCTVCNNEFKPRQSKIKYCSVKCCGKSLRRAVWPTKEELQKMITNMTWVGIGKKYNVSDNAVRKWTRKYKLLSR